jgi:hypothetical protein
VAAQVEAERVLLVREQFHLAPRRGVGQPNQRQTVLAVVASTKQVRLTVVSIALGPAAVFDRAIHRGQQLGAAGRH